MLDDIAAPGIKSISKGDGTLGPVLIDRLRFKFEFHFTETND